MQKKEQQKNSKSYSLGQEIFFTGFRGGLCIAIIDKVGRKYCQLRGYQKLQLDMANNRVISKENDSSYHCWPNREAYEEWLKLSSLKLEINIFFSSDGNVRKLSIEQLQQIKSILDGIQ